MFPSTILAFAAAVSSLVAVNGAILQRGGTLVRSNVLPFRGRCTDHVLNRRL